MFSPATTDALTNGGRLRKVQCHQELVAGIGAVQIQRAVEAQLHRLVDKVDLLEAMAQQLKSSPSRTVLSRQGIEVTKHLFVVPVLHSLAPDGDIEHLHHPLFRIRKRCKIKVIQTRKNIQQERNPAARVNHGDLANALVRISSSGSEKSSMTSALAQMREKEENL